MNLNPIAIVIAIVVGLVCLAVGIIAGIQIRKNNAEKEIGSAEQEATRIVNVAIKEAESKKREALVEAREEIHREQLGELVFLNTDYLSRIFKKEKGISISNYIIQKRVEEAKKLLTQSTLPINTVSLYVGYSNFSYFTKMFKDNTGYAPLEYRRSFSEK